MDFQVHGSVLVDGEWVSRPADVYQVMAHDRQQEDVEMDQRTIDYLIEPPDLGILTKTVVESPLYSTIVPANIRHKDVDDVVLVGEDFVHLKEICDYGHLRHVASKSDFKGKILAAKAFGDPRKVEINTSEQSPLLTRASLHRERKSMTGEEEVTLPLEVIVLTLSTRTLMFLWAKDNPTGPTTFVQRMVQLPTAASQFNRPGQHLAIDPKCRAIAVAAPEGCFMLYKTKTMDVWRRDMREGHDEVPIVEEARCSIDGRIMHMDFLAAGSNEDDAHIILAFILVHEGRTKVAVFDWDARNTLEIGARWDRAPRNPDFDKEAFYLAREDGAIIYVERQDGANLLEIADAGSWPYPIDTAFACLKADGSEFAQSFPDVLVAGGFGSDGHLCKVGAWPKEYAYKVPYSESNAFGFVESIPNWAPLTDMSITHLPNMPLPHDRDRASIFVTNGKAPFGEVSQLRRGLRALVDDSFGGMRGSTGLWMVDHGTNIVDQDGDLRKEDYASFVVNAPPETLVLRASRTQEEGSFSNSNLGSKWDGGVWETVQPIQDGLVRNAETIAACLLSEQFAVQITYKEAIVLRRPDLNQVGTISFTSPLLGAAAKPGLPLIVVAFRKGSDIILQVIPILKDGSFGPPGEDANQHLLKREPTCIDILISDIAPIIFIGTSDIGLSIFKIDNASAVKLLVDDQGDMSLLHTYESAVLLTTHGHQKLACGTRDGLLVCSDIDIGAEKVDSIWLDDPQHPAYLQGPANAIDQVPFRMTSDGSSLGGFIFAIFGDRMVFARLDYDVKWASQSSPATSPEQSKVIPRKLPTISTPLKLLVAEDLPHHTIVVTNDIKEERSPPRGYRTVTSSLKIVDLCNDESNTESEIKEESTPTTPRNKLYKTEVPLKNYERVHSMIRWGFLDGKGRQRALVVVGTGITEALGKESGRRLVLNITKSGLDLQDKKKFDKPVRCIAVYDNQHIVSIVGTTLQVEQLERTDAARWKRRGQIELPSAGAHMTVSGNFIYVSSSHDSHLCYEIAKLTEPQEETTFQFRQIFSDSRQRSSLRHLVFKFPVWVTLDPTEPERSEKHTLTTVLLTDKGASVSGLLHPTGPTNKIGAVTLFEACLPRSVIRIQRGDIRPPWRRPYDPHKGHFISTGILTDDIIGACTDGTIYSFYILNAPARQLLRLIQNLIEAKLKRDPALQYSNVKQNSGHIFDLLQNRAEGFQDGKIKARDVDPEFQERGPGVPRLKHVDGDVLRRFFEQDGDLRNLIENGCDEDVWKLFIDKAKPIAVEDDAVARKRLTSNSTMDSVQTTVIWWVGKWVTEHTRSCGVKAVTPHCSFRDLHAAAVQLSSFSLNPDNITKSGFLGFAYRQWTVKPKAPASATSLEGKTALVTGANSGLGLEAARELVAHKLSRLIATVRDVTKGEAAEKSILEPSFVLSAQGKKA
ncbi:hypothetical protein N0V90_011534 [Kalmusia sp. IMI 367209]|nr:hypothetical protein N0V90_011534 [Kalmusia sp. IMI 367209]